jgi:two-component system, LytTR family, sensor kinase
MESPPILTYRDPLDAERSAHPSLFFRMLSPQRREVFFWMLQTSFWVGIGVIGLLMTVAFKSAIPGVGWTIFMRMASGFAETVALRWIYRRPKFRQRNGFAKWPLAIGCCLALALLEILILQALIVAGIAFPGSAETVGVRLLVVRLFILAVWSALYFGFHLLENAHALELRAAKAELTARENELRHLQAQMNPHFLFNALNAVLACKDDPIAVGEVTQSLAKHLRFLLQPARPLEPLSREIDALEKFLTVQSAHFGGKLVCRIQCEKAARDVLVPPMIVQPLLVDAFHDRPQSNDLPLQIWLTARVEEGFLRITVSHTGDRVSPDAHPPSGSGIRSLQQRLGLLLGPRVAVVQQTDKGWVRVTIHVPLAGSAREAALK